MIKEFLFTAFTATNVATKINYLKPGAYRNVTMITGIERALQSESCKNININLILSFIKVESDYVVSAIGSNSKSKDYGLMQINSTHVKRDNLSVYLLINDANYNVQTGCRILGWFLQRYTLSEAIRRYNCGTKKTCVTWGSVVNYESKIMKYYNQLNRM